MQKGLAALIPEAESNMSAVSHTAAIGGLASAEAGDRILNIPLAQLHSNTLQPRSYFDPKSLHDLAESIRQHGILQPLVVTPRGRDAYEIVAGERRFRAAGAVGLKTVPCIVRNTKDLERLELALIENIQREDLDPIERASAYRKLIDEFGLTQESAAQRLGKPRSVLANALRLLELPGEVQRAISQGTISEGHGKVLAGLASEGQQHSAYSKVIAGDLNVRETEALAKNITGKRGTRRRHATSAPTAADDLQDLLATRVIVRRRGVKGTIVISFDSEEELRRIVRKILRRGE